MSSFLALIAVADDEAGDRSVRWFSGGGDPQVGDRAGGALDEDIADGLTGAGHGTGDRGVSGALAAPSLSPVRVRARVTVPSCCESSTDEVPVVLPLPSIVMALSNPSSS